MLVIRFLYKGKLITWFIKPELFFYIGTMLGFSVSVIILICIHAAKKIRSKKSKKLKTPTRLRGGNDKNKNAIDITENENTNSDSKLVNFVMKFLLGDISRCIKPNQIYKIVDSKLVNALEDLLGKGFLPVMGKKLAFPVVVDYKVFIVAYMYRFRQSLTPTVVYYLTSAIQTWLKVSILDITVYGLNQYMVWLQFFLTSFLGLAIGSIPVLIFNIGFALPLLTSAKIGLGVASLLVGTGVVSVGSINCNNLLEPLPLAQLESIQKAYYIDTPVSVSENRLVFVQPDESLKLYERKTIESEETCQIIPEKIGPLIPGTSQTVNREKYFDCTSKQKHRYVPLSKRTKTLKDLNNEDLHKEALEAAKSSIEHYDYRNSVSE